MSKTAEEKILEIVKRIKSISNVGLLFTENDYDKERYEELLSISRELLETISDTPLTALDNFFIPDRDYPTPKVDIRGFVLNEAKEVLLVKEMADGKWSLPGGWGDIGFSPSEVVLKEIEEETGLTAKVNRLLAVYDKKCHPHPPQPFYIYKVVFLCEIVKGEIKSGFDIADANYFNIENLPPLSEERILESQIKQLYKLAVNMDEKAYFD